MPLPKLYICGPMTGFTDYNFPAFEKARRQLEAAGYEVECPTDNGSEDEPGAHPWVWYMRAALRQLLRTEAVAVLPESAVSLGAHVEITVARSLNMPVRTVADWLTSARLGSGAEVGR